MCFEYLSLFIAIARRAETRRRLTLTSRAIATAATFVSTAAGACGGERDLSAVVQRVSDTPSLLSLSLSLSLAPAVNHSLGLSLLSRIITVSRRNRPGNGTHTQHASRRVLYSTRGVPSETNNGCAVLSAVSVTCLISATVVLFLIRGRVCDIAYLYCAKFVCGCRLKACVCLEIEFFCFRSRRILFAKPS